jgi:hypothetical protein
MFSNFEFLRIFDPQLGSRNFLNDASRAGLGEERNPVINSYFCSTL